MNEEEMAEYKADVVALNAENKKYRCSMLIKTIGLVILPFLAWSVLSFVDFGKPVTSVQDQVLVLVQLPIILLYLISIVVFPRYTLPLLALVLVMCTAMLIVSNEKNVDTRSPNAWSAAPAPEDPMHVRFTPFIVICVIVLGFMGSYCRMTFPDSTYPYTKLK